MKIATNIFVDKIYKLTRDTAPLSLILASRHTQRFPLLHFDEKTGKNKSLRYARNQNSPFEEEQDNNAIITPVIFENGFLNVPKNNQVLQKFLHYHPGNGTVFVEVNKAKDAAKKVEKLNSQVDALIEARQLTLDQIENVSRVLFHRDVSQVSTEELKRDILVFANAQPEDFLLVLKDPMLKLNAKIQLFFDKSLLYFKNGKKEVWFNTPSNKTKMMNIPFQEEPVYMVASFFQSKEGLESLKHLSELSKNI